MKKNVGSVDRAVRIVVGALILGWGVATNNWLGAIGLVPLLTGSLQWCPAYCPFGISTAGSGSCCCGSGECEDKK